MHYVSLTPAFCALGILGESHSIHIYMYQPPSLPNFLYPPVSWNPSNQPEWEAVIFSNGGNTAAKYLTFHCKQVGLWQTLHLFWPFIEL